MMCGFWYFVESTYEWLTLNIVQIYTLHLEENEYDVQLERNEGCDKVKLCPWDKASDGSLVIKRCSELTNYLSLEVLNP